MNEYPQVAKTGADAVHETLPTEGLYYEENVIWNLWNDDWNIDHRWRSKRCSPQEGQH